MGLFSAVFVILSASSLFGGTKVKGTGELPDGGFFKNTGYRIVSKD